MSGLLDGKRLLVTGVITDASIAFSVAKLAQEQGATVVLTGFGRMSLVERIAKRLPGPAPVIELDVTNPEHLAALADRVREHVDGLDGVVHSIGFAPAVRARRRLPGHARGRTWPPRCTSPPTRYKSLAMAALPLMRRGRLGRRADLRRDHGLAGLRLDGRGQGRAGVGLPLPGPHLGPQGIRGNLVAAGPLRTMAARSRSRASTQFEDAWAERAPLGWDLTDPEPAARACVALLSDWFPATTGEIVHVDGGYHAIGV